MISDKMNTKHWRGDYLTIRMSQVDKPVIVVGKKISNKAVVRNRLRRQIKELIAQTGHGSVIVRVAKLPPFERSFTLFKQDLERCLPTLR